MTFFESVGGLASVLLLGYLTVALVKPEWFQ